MTLTADERIRLRRLFGELENEPVRPPDIYIAIGKAIADSPSAIDRLETLDPPKRTPELLFAAVHYLILQGSRHPLSLLYSSSTSRQSIAEAGATFLQFSNEHWSDINDLIRRRNVQTNEVNRAVGMLPALMEVGRVTHRPLALIELGTGAGLTLLFDRFRYDYVGGSTVGPPGAQVRLSTQVRGKAPPLDATAPIVDFRVGLDNAPVDVNDEEQTRWLYACLDVGDVAREQRLETAIDLAKREWPNVKRGDILQRLPEVVAEVDPALPVVIYSSWLMDWLSQPQRQELDDLITSLGHRREIWWISFDSDGSMPGLKQAHDVPTDGGVVGLQRLQSNERDARVLAYEHRYGNWLDWR